MRASELLAGQVVDSTGTTLGPLRDLRVDVDPDDGTVAVRWLVIGGRELAHRFGYFDGRTRGPMLLDRLLRGSHDSAVAVPASAVASWGPGRVVLRGPGDVHAVPIEEAARRW